MSKKITKIRIQKTAQPHEIARARGNASPLADHFGPNKNDDETFEDPFITAERDSRTKSNSSSVDWGSVVNTAAQVGGSVAKSTGGRVSKKKFYDYRDRVYQFIVDSGKDYASLPGNPFQPFSHGAIKDSPVKNYAGELSAFKNTVKKYFPEIYATLENENVDINRKLGAFSIDGGDVSEILKDVSSDYVKNLQRKRNNGESLTEAERKILEAYEYLENKVRGAAKNEINERIGDWLVNNWYVVVAGIIILILLLKKK